MPGYTYFFVDSVPKQCICPICKLPMQAPVILTSCQHTFCDSCLRPRHANIRASLDFEASLMCPLDEVRVDARNVQVSVDLREIIETCMVRCPQEPQGCRWVDIVRHVPAHLETCRYVAVPCPENCGDMICRVFLNEHINHACSRRRRQCQFCKTGFNAEDFQKHEGACPEEQVWCENKCGQRMPRRKLERHSVQDCGKREVACSFCKKIFLFDTLQVHVQQCTLKGAAPPIPPHQQHQQQQQYSTSTSTSNSSSTEAAIRSAVGKGADSAASTSPLAATPESTLDKPQFHSQHRLSQHRQQPLQEPPPPVPRRAASAECLDGGRGIVDCPLKWCGCQFKGDRASVDRHQRDASSGARHVTLLAEMARAQRREIESLKRQLRHLPLVHNGHLVWRIDNYAEKLADSQRNRELEFCSVPFYTGRPGYRLQASAFLNGNGSGSGRYLSLYVKLLPGEYDPILTWPFVRPIRMRLLDQRDSASSRSHLEESFTPDPTWRHFRRPGRDAAAAFGFGFPKFAAHEILQQQQQQEANVDSSGCCYVRDNAIFFEIEVQPN